MTPKTEIPAAVRAYRDARSEADELERTEKRTAIDTAERHADLAARREEASRRAKVDHVEKARWSGDIAESSAAEEAATETFEAAVIDPDSNVGELFAAWTEMQSARSVRHWYMSGINRYLSYVNNPDRAPVEWPNPRAAESFGDVLNRVANIRVAAAVNVLHDSGVLYVEADAAGADAAAAVT